MGFFSDNHVLQAGLQGSAGPEVSLWNLFQQNIRQQFRVDSPFTRQAELGSRWGESLDALRAAGQNFNTPFDPQSYLRFEDFTRGGAPVTTADDNPLDARYGTTPSSEDFENLRRANEAIRQLHNPNIKTFEQILAEVDAMQHGIEGETASMHERGPTGTWAAELLGGAAGSFTLRDPLNLATMPLGFGRSIVTRVAVDMAVAGGTTAITDLAMVNPNRVRAGLPKRNPYFDIAAATLGAGLIRGAFFELPGAVYRRTLGAVGDNIDFNLRDVQMQQMFAAADHSPSARAAASILDDTIVFEHTNPYGEGQVAGYRWQADLEATARALNGEPEARIELPPLPSEYIDRHLSFQMVKETVPELWNELEVARTRLADLDNTITEVSGRELSIPDAVRLVDEEAGARLDQLEAVVNDMSVPEPVRAAADMEARTTVLRVGQDKIMKAVEAADTAAKFEVQNLRASRKAANKKYRAAYQKVEAEAQRLEHAEVAKRSVAQVQSIDVIGPSVVSEPMTGPLTRFDFVEAHAGRVDAAEAAAPAKADAVNDLEINPETNTVDIGTKTPVSADFKVPFEEGELSVREVLDDLAEDRRLEEAVKGCAI